MNAMRICFVCSKPLAANAPQGLCPECLLKVGLGTGVDIGLDSQGETEPRQGFFAGLKRRIVRRFRRILGSWRLKSAIMMGLSLFVPSMVLGVQVVRTNPQAEPTASLEPSATPLSHELRPEDAAARSGDSLRQASASDQDFRSAGSSLPAGADSQLTGIQKRVFEVIRKAGPATVRIARGANDRGGFFLSGTIVTTNGYVVTRGQHGLSPGTAVIFYLADGRRVTGEVLGASWGLDIGLMRITEKGSWPYVEFGRSSEVKAGDLCLALGYPLLHKGPSSSDRELAPRVGRLLTSAAPLWFSISCPLDTGDEGGGLFDLQGRLIGINAHSLALGSLNRRDRAGAICTGIELFQKHWDELTAGKQIDGLPWPAARESVEGTARMTDPASAPAANDPRVAAAMEKAQPATIRFGTGEKATAYVSGVIVTEDGYIVTVAHHDRLAGEDVTICLPDGRTVAGQVLGSNPLSDIGLVKIMEKGQWPHVELGNSIALKRGDSCILMGYPFLEFPGGLWDTNRRPTIRTGVVVDTVDMTGVFKTSCGFSPGFSGGGLFDLDGRLVGVHEGGDSERGPARHRRIELVRIQWGFLATAKPYETMATNAPNPITKAFREVVRGVGPITVEVIGDNKRCAWGTIVGSGGWILTKASELYGSLSCRLPDGRNLTAVVRGTSPDHDLALLKVNAENLPAARWSERDEIPVGTLVAALGCGEPPRVGTVYHPAHPIPREASRLWGGTIRDGQGGVELSGPPDQEESPLQPGDVITDVETHPTPDSNAFFKLTQDPNAGVPSVIAGDPIRVGVRRGKTTLELHFPLPAQDGTNPESQSHRRSAFPSVFTTDMVILPNQCGGPVVNESGLVVGITIARPYSDEGRIYVIPAVVARQVAADLGSPNADREKGK